MDEETLEASRRRYATTDANDRSTRLLTEVATGATKEQSLVVSGPEDAALWDRLAADIAAIKAKGGVVIYGYRHGED